MAEGGVENIVKQGYLRRINTSNNRFSGLFKRAEGNKWFVLVVRQDSPFLQQYDADVDVFSRSPSHSYNLAQCKAVRSMGSSDPPTFCMVCADKVIELVAASRTQMLDWVTTVESCLVDLGIITKEPVEHVYTVCPAVVRKPRVSKEVLEEREAEALRQTTQAQVPTTQAPTVPAVSESSDQQASNSYRNSLPVENRLAPNSVDEARAMEPRPRLPARSKTLNRANTSSSSVTEIDINGANGIDSVPPPLPSRPSTYRRTNIKITPQNSLNPPIHPTTESSNDSDFVSPEVIAQLRMNTESSQPPSSSHTNVSYSLSSSMLSASTDSSQMRDLDTSRSRSPHSKENDMNLDPVLSYKPPNDSVDPSGFSSSSSSSLSSLGPFSELEQLPKFSDRSLASAALENDYSFLPSDVGACASVTCSSDVSKNTPSSPSACSSDNTKPKPFPRHALVKQDCLQDEVHSSEEFSFRDRSENLYDNNMQSFNVSHETSITSEDDEKENDSYKLKDVNENCYGLIFDPSVANIPFIGPISPTHPIPPLPPRHDSLPEAPHVQHTPHETFSHVAKHNGDAAPPLPLPRRNPAGSIRGLSSHMSTSKRNASQDLEIPPMPPRRRPPLPSKMVSLDGGLKDIDNEDRPPALPSRPSQSFYIKRPQLLSHLSDNSALHTSAVSEATAAAVSDLHGVESNASQSGLSRMMLLDRANSLHTVVSLKQTQAEILQSEIAMPSLTLTLTQKSGHGLALVDWNGHPCVVGWNQRDFPSLHGKLHLGDQLISVNGVKVPSTDVAQKLLKGATTPKITVALHRMPCAKVFAIRRDADGQSLGIKREGGSGEIVYVDPNGLAAQHGLTAYAPGASTELRCNWFITEINNRPISLFFKENEIEHRLAAVGREISIVVQPSDFIQEIRRQFKKMRNYKSYIAQ